MLLKGPSNLPTSTRPRKNYDAPYSPALMSLFLTSPTGSHVEWCKQLIAATISSQISGPVPPDALHRDSRVCI